MAGVNEGIRDHSIIRDNHVFYIHLKLDLCVCTAHHISKIDLTGYCLKEENYLWIDKK